MSKPLKLCSTNIGWPGEPGDDSVANQSGDSVASSRRASAVRGRAKEEEKADVAPSAVVDSFTHRTTSNAFSKAKVKDIVPTPQAKAMDARRTPKIAAGIS